MAGQIKTIYFGSDNQSGAHPDVIAAIARCAEGRVPAYGDDLLTRNVEEQINDIFETECETFLVATGTAANALILSAMCPPWGAIYSHADAHIINDENTAPELFGGGSRQVGIQGAFGKPSIECIEAAIASAIDNGVHSAKPAAISLTNATECGTCLLPDELARYGELAAKHGLGLHVDGARFSNALISTGATPAELTWKSGVDALSFGATKNGVLAAEAVVFFNRRFSEDFEYRRKRAGHLWSKHQFLAAQFNAFLNNDLWLKNAAHANAQAQRLAEGLAKVPGVQLPWPVEANEVFPILPPGLAEALAAEGFDFYSWPSMPGMVRFVTSFNTDPADVSALLEHIHRLAPRFS